MSNIREFQYRAPRFDTDFHFLLLTDLGQLVLHGRCLEISKQGLVAWVSEPLEVGTKATLILTLPGGSSEMMIAAVVTRRHGPDHAFTFVSIPAPDRPHLHQYLLPHGDSGA